MDDDGLSGLAALLAREARQYKPKLAEQQEKFSSLLAASRERNAEGGGATEGARQALQKLRHPLLLSTHHNKARAVAATAFHETGKTLADRAEQAVIAWALHMQAKVEWEIHSQDTAPQFASREGRPANERETVAQFCESLEKRGVPLYLLGRGQNFQLDLIAGLVADMAEDRRGADDNWWRILFSHGVFEAFSGSMSEDEALMLASSGQLRESPEALVYQERLEERLGRELKVTPAFAATCWAISQDARELETKDQEALRCAEDVTQELAVDAIMKLFGAITPDERVRVQAFVDFVTRYSSICRENDDRIRIRRVLDVMERSIATYEERKLTPARWLGKLRADLLDDECLASKALSDESSFYSLLLIALERSKSFTKLSDTLLEEGRRRMAVEARGTIDTWLENGWDCYLDADGNPHLGLPDEDQEGCICFAAPKNDEADFAALIEQSREAAREAYAKLDANLNHSSAPVPEDAAPPTDAPVADDELRDDEHAHQDDERSDPLGAATFDRPPGRHTTGAIDELRDPEPPQGRFEGLD